MSDIIYKKTCYDCDIEMEYLTMDFTQEEGKPTTVDMDFMGGKEFECSGCGKKYYLSDDMPWYVEDKEGKEVY